MNTVIPLSPPLMRIGLAAIGSTLLWFGAYQISIVGIFLMLMGLVALVSAVSPPRPSLIVARPPRALTQVPSESRSVS